MRTTGQNASSAENAHTYEVPLSTIDKRMEEIRVIRITPFNPLSSVRFRGQESRGDGSIGNMFVSLEALLQDCNAMPEGWADSVIQLMPAFRA